MKIKKYSKSNRPVFRNPDKYQVLPWREWIRTVMPTGHEGFIVQDLDLIVYRFGSLISRSHDKYGQFIMLDVKYKKFYLEYSQKILFGLIDCLLRKADPEQNNYKGFYILVWDDDPNEISINGTLKGMENVKNFLLGKITTTPFRFENIGKFK